MEQFSLEKYLENPSRKVVTRDRRPVRILDYNLKGDKRICIAVDDKTQESITTVDENGHCLIDETGYHASSFDLFFASEDELTEFKKIMIEFSHARNSLIQFERPMEEITANLYRYSEKLFNLARKELLKDLPKWKKATEHKDVIDVKKPIVVIVDDKVLLSSYIEKDDYYIELDNLKTLPKEE